MSDERGRILKLLEEGKITADQAVRLLDALKERRVEPEPAPVPPMHFGRRMHRRFAVRGIECIPDIVSEAISSSMKQNFGPDADGASEFPDCHDLEVNNVSGDATVTGWDENRVKLALAGSGLTRATNVHGKVVVRSVSGDVEAQVPRDARLVLVSVSGDVEASGINGRCAVKTVSGDADISECAGGLNAETVSGDLELVRVGGELRIESKSGDIDLEPIGAFSGTVVSKSGDVTLRLRPDADIVLDLECEEEDEGEIELDLEFPHEVLEQKDSRMKMKVGPGSRQLKVRTRTADITVTEAKER
jgi:DUF4097 and DUF4098 domain-containing protein YvlB